MVQGWQNHWKTIDGNGALEKKHYHPIVTKKWPSLKSRADDGDDDGDGYDDDDDDDKKNP